MMKIGQKYLITTHNWFFAPDGENYKAVWGTVRGVMDSKTTLGVDTNRNSTNWYVVIGDMVLAGCQVFYAVRAETVNFAPTTKAEVDTPTGRVLSENGTSRIWNADASGLDPTADLMADFGIPIPPAYTCRGCGGDVTPGLPHSCWGRDVNQV